MLKLRLIVPLLHALLAVLSLAVLLRLLDLSAAAAHRGADDPERTPLTG
ncbi:hypothetical protein [Frigoribacterium salinisoli]